MDIQDILTRFAAPDKLYRPVQIIHNGFPKEEGQDAYIERALRAGIGGFVLTMGVSRDDALPDAAAERVRSADVYMSDADCPDWERMRAFIDRCYAAELKVWLYDENTYPSGMAATKVLARDPSYQARGLCCLAKDVDGGVGVMSLDGGRVLGAAAYPAVDEDTIRIAGAQPVRVASDAVSWNLPDGKWRVCVFYTKPIAYGTYFGDFYPDMLRADVVRAFLDITHDRYVKHLGEERVRRMEAIFTDEPSIATHGCSSWFDERGAVAGWTDAFERAFPARYGYDLFEHLPEFFYRTETDFGRVRADYWRLVADAFAENFFGQIESWCDEHGIESTGHLYGEESLGMQIGLNGDLFGLHCRMQMPGVDRLYATDPRDVTPEKTASSAAHLMGRRRTMSESSFHFEGAFWSLPENVTPENMLNSCYYQYVLGINNITSYYPYHKFADADIARWATALGRIGALLDGGEHRAAALVHIPMEAAWRNYQPRSYKYWTVGPTTVSAYEPKQLRDLEKAYGDALLALMDTRRDFDLIDTPHLDMVAVRDGQVATPAEHYDALVVFAYGAPDADVLAHYRRLLAAGARLVVVPVGTPDAAYAALAADYPAQVALRDPADAGIDLPAQLDLDVDSAVWLRHSLLDGRDLYLLHNRTPDPRDFALPVRGTLLDPITGDVSPAGARVTIPGKAALMLLAD